MDDPRKKSWHFPIPNFAHEVHPDDNKRLWAQHSEMMKNNKSGNFTMYAEFRLKLPNGEYVWVDDTFTVIPGPDGQFEFQVGFGSVIEERKRLEENLRQARETLEERVKERTLELAKVNQTLIEVMLKGLFPFERESAFLVNLYQRNLKRSSRDSVK
ncbi:MAG: PAS domain-containing protein [Candidatus Riflebacteria bacterium]|nr:PAS domain-containing protein [Candidatus Riflebacteria bacterium]